MGEYAEDDFYSDRDEFPPEPPEQFPPEEATKWEDMSNNALQYMDFLGEFGPTANIDDRQIKGYMIDCNSGEGCKVYLSSEELRKIAIACIEVADWLDNRAGMELAP